MSIKLINLVWESKATRRPHLTPSEKNVLTQIANNADDTGLAVSLKVEAIERRTNLDERTIQKAFRVLQERGFVTIHQRTGRVSHYQLHIDRFMTTPGHTPGVVNGAPREARSDEKSTRETVAPPPASAARPSVAQTKREEVDASDPRSRATSTPGHTPGVSCGEVCGEDIHPPPASGHPSSLLLQSISPSLLPGEPDDLKNSGGEKQKGGDRNLEQRRADQLAKIRARGIQV